MSDTQPDVTLSAAYRAVAVTFASMIYKSKAMAAVLKDSERVADTTVNCLILGETGTGKNLLAQAIHNASPCAEGPFVSLNCSAIPDTLIESELFGSDEGAFTGATKTRKGRFELADGGTLFLDEIGDLSLQAQAKILHAIEYREYTPVGGEETKTSKVRIIAATNLDLEERVANDLFRQDLLYRLNEVELRIPSLRERPEDLGILIEHFIEECNIKYHKHVKKVDRATLKELGRHNWPGNVRELRSVIKRGVARAESDVLKLEDLQLRVALVDQSAPLPQDGDFTLASAEKKHIESVLRLNGWVKSESARLLGITRPTLDRKIHAYDLTPQKGDEE